MNIWIPGEPKAQPRPRARSITTKAGKASSHIYVPNKTTQPWIDSITASLTEEDTSSLDGIDSYYIALWFHLKRPKNHYRSGKYSHLLKESAPIFNTSKPDVDNLSKLVLDVLQRAEVIQDDSQVVRLTAVKTWASEPGCLLVLEPLSDLNALHTIEANIKHRARHGSCTCGAYTAPSKEES